MRERTFQVALAVGTAALLSSVVWSVRHARTGEAAAPESSVNEEAAAASPSKPPGVVYRPMASGLVEDFGQGSSVVEQTPAGMPSADSVAGSIPAPGSILPTSPDYEATRERFLDLAASMHGTLELTVADLPGLQDELWDRHPMYAALLTNPPDATLDSLLATVRPKDDLERVWERDNVKQLWSDHQQLYTQQYLTTQQRDAAGTDYDRDRLAARLAEIRVHLDATRRAIWSATGDPAYPFLLDLGSALR